MDRRSLPITAHEEFIPRVIMTQSGDQVLDFGQNLAGWVEFKNRLPKGDKVTIDFGEIMQDGEFYRDNLRSARAQFTSGSLFFHWPGWQDLLRVKGTITSEDAKKS